MVIFMGFVDDVVSLLVFCDRVVKNMADAPASPGGGSHESGEHSPRSNVR